MDVNTLVVENYLTSKLDSSEVKSVVTRDCLGVEVHSQVKVKMRCHNVINITKWAAIFRVWNRDSCFKSGRLEETLLLENYYC